MVHGMGMTSIPSASLWRACFINTSMRLAISNMLVRNRALVALSLGYAIPTDAPDYGIHAQQLNDLNTSKNNLSLPSYYAIALHGTSRDSKLWPEAEWIGLGRLLAQRGLNLVLPWSNPAEFARATYIASQLPQALVLPKLSIHQLASIIAQANVAIGVDTGLSHLAVALNIPTVAIYTDTNPALTGVMQGAVSPAVNLGGIAQIPSHTDILAALTRISNTQ
jgi:heptosyltransferase I